MTTALNELLQVLPTDKSPEDKSQIWIIGSRDQVTHTMNEFYVKKIANDRVKFTPIISAPFAAGKYMTVLIR